VQTPEGVTAGIELEAKRKTWIRVIGDMLGYGLIIIDHHRCNIVSLYPQKSNGEMIELHISFTCSVII
jgi:hypothetical protein